MKCLVSGATGFIGRQLCQQLLSQGYAVTALSKSGAVLPDGTPTEALDLAVTTPSGALPERVSEYLAELMDGVDVVFHLAGIAHQRALDSAYRELNTLGTLGLARSAAVAGVKRFVFLSSVKAMGPAADAAARSELDCTEPADAYGLSKWQAECSLREEYANKEMAVIILRPALVYGPAVKGNLSLLASAVRVGLPRPPAAGGRSMIALEDLVDLLCVVASHHAAGTQTWIVCDGGSYTTRQIYDVIREALGRGPGVAWLPRWGWRLAAATLDLVKAGGGESTFDKLFGAERYNNARILADLDWQPRITLDDTMATMLTPAGSDSR